MRLRDKVALVLFILGMAMIGAVLLVTLIKLIGVVGFVYLVIGLFLIGLSLEIQSR